MDKHKSDLHENLILLERALFNSNICNFVQCEVKIFAIREDTKIKIHTELLDLIPSQKQLITCQAKSSTHVSTWHNQLASISGLDTLILKDKMIQISNLQNESYVNRELRFLMCSICLIKRSYNACQKLSFFWINNRLRVSSCKQ